MGHTDIESTELYLWNPLATPLFHDPQFSFHEDGIEPTEQRLTEWGFRMEPAACGSCSQNSANTSYYPETPVVFTSDMKHFPHARDPHLN